jgi:hypothetical protein
MEQEELNVNNRSSEVQEVLGSPPSWLVRYGTMLALLIVVGLACISVMVEYPDVVKGNINILSSDPPRKLVAQRGNYIDQILVNNEDTVKKEALLVVFESQANFIDVLHLEELLSGVRDLSAEELLRLDPPRDMMLGGVQSSLYDFSEKQAELRKQRSRRRERPSERELRSQLRQTQQFLASDRSRKDNLENQLDLVNQRLARNKHLLERKEIDFGTVRRNEEEIYALNREMQGLESNIRAREFEIKKIQRQIDNLQVENQESINAALSRLEESFLKLKDHVKNWKKEFLLTSPIDGVVLFTPDNLRAQQYIDEQTELMMILPTVMKRTVGSMKVDLKGAAKVEPGQKVVVKLSSFPVNEFGAVIGEVEWKGSVPNEDNILITVDFPNGLVTNRGNVIEPIRALKGQAQVITQDRKFVEMIFDPGKDPALGLE